MSTQVSARDFNTPYSLFAPTGLAKLLLLLTRNTVLGRGKSRRMATQLLKNLVHTPIDDEVNGFRGRFYLSGNDCEAKFLTSPKKYNCVELNAVSDRVTPNFRFVDIGANFGLYALHAAHIANEKGVDDAKILAVEPFPDLYEQIRFNAQANGFENLEAVNVAVGGEDGEAMLHVNEAGLGTSSILPQAGNSQTTEVKVTVRPLEKLLAEAGFNHVDVMKIDIEGYEDRALVPFFETADKSVWPRFIIIEYVNDENWETDCISLLKSLGYRENFRERNNMGLELVSNAD